jgi:hypothetical protein
MLTLLPFIDIIRHPYEEPHHVCLVVTASNGSQQGKLEIYANASDLGDFARSIREVPGRKAEALWELGSELPNRFAFYFRLRVHQIALTGQCAVEVRLNNNLLAPDRQISEFSLRAMPADLDRFATLLAAFGRLEHRELKWLVTSGELIE